MIQEQTNTPLMKSLFAALVHHRGAMTCLARTYVGIPRESYSFRLVLALHSSETLHAKFGGAHELFLRTRFVRTREQKLQTLLQGAREKEKDPLAYNPSGIFFTP